MKQNISGPFGQETLTVGERLRLLPRLGEVEEDTPSRTQVSQLGKMGGLESHSNFRRRRRRRRSCVVGLPLNKSPESATSRASEPGACEGEGDYEVEATHFGCWDIYRLRSRFVIKD